MSSFIGDMDDKRYQVLFHITCTFLSLSNPWRDFIRWLFFLCEYQEDFLFMGGKRIRGMEDRREEERI